MELNDPIRNRRAGFFGVAVATLLTPGGKLFTSAMAATALGVAGVALLANDGTTSNAQSSPSVANISSEFNNAELLGQTDLPASESGYDPLIAATSSTGNNQQQIVLSTSQSSLSTAGMPAGINNTASTVSMGNGGSIGGMGIGAPQTFPGEPNGSDQAGELPEAPGITEPIAGPTDQPGDNPDEKPNDEIILAEAFPDSDPLKGPDVLPASPPPSDGVPLITDAGLPGIQPFLGAAQIPIPSTLGLLLLGLVNLGWLYRRRYLASA